MANPNVHPIINPETPLAYLPATTANQFEASRYLLIATLGVLIYFSIKAEYPLTFDLAGIPMGLAYVNARGV